MTFNAEKHLIELQGKAYLEVQWRLVWFVESCPEGKITIVEKIIDPDREITKEVATGKWIENPNRPGKKMPEKAMVTKRGWAYFHVRVEDGKGKVGEAVKSECAVDFDDYIEKADTGATGRALAKIGYGTQFAPEMNEQHRIVDAPVEREQAQSNGHTAAKPVQEQEHSESFNTLVARARTRAYKLGIKGDQWIAYVTHVTGKQAEQALDIADVGKINGDLTAKEQPAREKQPA